MIPQTERDVGVDGEKGDREDTLEAMDGMDRTNTAVVERSDKRSIHGNFVDGD